MDLGTGLIAFNQEKNMFQVIFGVMNPKFWW